MVRSFDPDPEEDVLDDKKGQHHLRFLKPRQVLMLDNALCALGDYGELHLVVDKGRLRFLVMQKSYDANKFQPLE